MNNFIIKRPKYINKLLSFKDAKVIKIITGIRRCGKSTLFDLYCEELLNQGIKKEQILIIKLEELENEHLLDYKILHTHIMNNIIKEKQNYVFLDEIQKVTDFQKTVRSLFEKNNIDIYLTGSNSKLQSGEWATSIAGRYVEIEMFPLSFKEFVDTYNKETNLDKLYSQYLEYSSFPYAQYFVKLAAKDLNVQIKTYLEGLFNTIVLNDIMDNKGISDTSRLVRVIKFISSCIGSEISLKKISDTMTSDGIKIMPNTIENYINALKDAYILYKAERYDIKGKRILKTLNKFYLVDMGLRNFLLGNKNVDKGHILENVVYLELLRRGYNVNIGKIDYKNNDGKTKSIEVDFVAEGFNGIEYFQVSESLINQDVLKRELKSLEAIKDHYPKTILTRDYGSFDYNGIKVINVLEWLTNTQ